MYFYDEDKARYKSTLFAEFSFFRLWCFGGKSTMSNLYELIPDRKRRANWFNVAIKICLGNLAVFVWSKAACRCCLSLCNWSPLPLSPDDFMMWKVVEKALGPNPCLSSMRIRLKCHEMMFWTQATCPTGVRYSERSGRRHGRRRGFRTL